MLTHPDAAMTQRTAQLRRWRGALAGLAAMLAGLGIGRFGYGPLIPALIRSGWFDARQAIILGAVNLAGHLLGSAGAAYLSYRVPASELIRAGLIGATSACFACALPLGFGWYFAWRLLSGVAGGVLVVLAAPTVLAVTPVARRGRVGGVVFMGVGAGIALSGIGVPTLVRFGLPAAWLGLGALSALATALAWNGFERAAPPPLSTTRMPVPPGVASSPDVLLLVVAYGAYAFGYVPHTVFWVDFIARGLGLGLAVGGGHWVLLGLAAACGPPIMGALTERIGVNAGLLLSLVSMAAVVGLPLVTSHPVALAVSSVGAGGAGMSIASLMAGRVGELVPTRQHAQVWGWMTIAYAILIASGAYLLAHLFARTESYRLVFAIGAGALLLSCLLVLASSRYAPAGSRRQGEPS